MLGFIKSIFLSEERDRTKEIHVHIADLAQIWLKYNQSFTRVEPQEEREGASEREGSSGFAQQPDLSFFSQKMLQEFFEPYRHLFEKQQAAEGFLKLLQFIDRYQETPSIVETKGDTEADELYSIASILKNVTLGEHSANVARNMLKLLADTYRDYENYIPQALVVSFGHDIGKISILREVGSYCLADHPIVSALKVEELFREKPPLWLQSALDIIRNHHRPTKDLLTQLLIKADSRAREYEVVSCQKELKVLQWDEWFDVKRFLEIVLPEINVIHSGTKWKALSYHSIVFLQTDFVYEVTKKLASEKGVLDMLLLKASEKQEAIRRAAESLKKAGVLSPDLTETQWGRNYDLYSERFIRTMFLVPVKIEAFGVLPHVIEQKKEGYLKNIQKVAPSRKQKGG